MKQKEIEKKEAELKEAGTRFNTVTVFLDEDDTEKTATFFLRKPDKTVRQLAATTIQSKGGLQAVYAVIKNLYIAGDDHNLLLSNDYALASAEDAVVEMLQVHKALLKKN